MQCEYVHVFSVLLCTVLSAAPGEKFVGVLFRNKNGSAYGKEYYSIDSAIFNVSERLKRDIKCHTGENENQVDTEQMGVVVECEPKTFYIVDRLLEQFVLDIDIDAEDIINVLSFSAQLELTDRQGKKALYKYLAKTTTNDASFRRKMNECRDIPGIKIYMLQVLREYMGLFCIVVRVRENKVTLHHACENAYSGYGSADELNAVDEIKILRSAMSSIMSHKAMHMLIWFIDIMDICGLCMFLCKLDLDVMTCIGSMRGLTRLDLHCCIISRGSIKYIQVLNNLRELCITDYALCSEDLYAIGNMKNITNLKLKCCIIEQGGFCNIRKLHTLTELELSWMELSENNFVEIEKMKSLTTLDIHNSKVRPGFLKHISDMNKLKILNIYGIKGHSTEHGINRQFQKFTRIKMLGILRLSCMPLNKEDISVLHKLRQRNAHVVY